MTKLLPWSCLYWGYIASPSSARVDGIYEVDCLSHLIQRSCQSYQEYTRCSSPHRCLSWSVPWPYQADCWRQACMTADLSPTFAVSLSRFLWDRPFFRQEQGQSVQSSSNWATSSLLQITSLIQQLQFRLRVKRCLEALKDKNHNKAPAVSYPCHLRAACGPVSLDLHSCLWTMLLDFS